ncbi:MAG: small multi-drug export protein [Armatimonadota bacterium]|nr:small multi-drug export protein [Armatimonadota bacterium]MDR5696948.1 small multi-drug export protein [Armatimonadota bacterium]
MTQLLWIASLSLVPWIELRGSIPLGIARGFAPLEVFFVCTVVNLLVIVPGWFALEWFYERWFSRIGWVRRQVERVRERGRSYVERYQLLGLTLFVAVPLPGTGAYSGTLAAWLLGLPRAKSWLAVAAGVVLAGIAVTLASTGAVAGWRRLFP